MTDVRYWPLPFLLLPSAEQCYRKTLIWVESEPVEEVAHSFEQAEDGLVAEGEGHEGEGEGHEGGEEVGVVSAQCVPPLLSAPNYHPTGVAVGYRASRPRPLRCIKL